MKCELTFDSVYADSIKYNRIPRVHGNGMIQLDLDDNNKDRLNLWPEQKLPTQKNNSQIHSHRFSFDSRVIVGNGKLIHKVYKPWFVKHGDIYLYKPEPQKGQDTKLVKIDGSDCYMVIQSESRIWNDYHFNKAEYHETITEGMVMTIMSKTENDKSISAFIACNKELMPDNDYSRYQISTEDCWEHFKYAFKSLNTHWVNPYMNYAGRE